MGRRVFLTVLFMVLVIPALACAHAGKGNVVDVRIVSDRGVSSQSTGPIRVSARKAIFSMWRP